MDTLTYFYITVALMLASGGFGYYAGGRKLAGMEIDLANTKNEIEKVKNFVYPQKVTVVAPLAGGETANTTAVTATPTV